MAYSAENLADLRATLQSLYGSYANGANPQAQIQATNAYNFALLTNGGSLPFDMWGNVVAPPPPAAPVSQPLASPSPVPTAAPVDKPPARDFTADAKRLFPWIPNGLLSVFVGSWQTYGDVDLALADLRSNAAYDSYFPGIKRNDGSLRMNESEYLATIDGYKRRWAQYGLSPTLIEPRVVDLIKGDVSPDEWGNRLDELYLGIASQGDDVRRFYADNYGAGDVSDAALFGSAVLGESPQMIEHHIRVAQIGGESALHGFTSTLAEANRLADFGVDRPAARKLFGQAAQDLPTLSELVSRFNDPGDPLTLADYENAVVLNDPAELARISRLYSESAAQFSPRSLFSPKARGGDFTGLRQA